MRKLLEQTLIAILHDLGSTVPHVPLDIPTDEQFGDYTTTVALSAAKELQKAPLVLAEAIKDKLLEQHLPFIESVTVIKPGFLNISLNVERFISQINKMLTLGEKVDNARENEDTVIVEYSSPNIAKPFTIGHLRSTIIGDAIANLLESQGQNVLRDNHVGDWGTQFGKLLYAIEQWGNVAEIEQAERPVKLLVDLYIRFHEEAESHPEIEDNAREWFKKLELGDSMARQLWERCIAWSWKEFDLIYKRLGVAFTENNGRGYGEAFFEDKMGPVIEELKQKGLLEESEGAKLVFFPGNTYPPLMIVKKDGTTLYATRDLATDKFRQTQYGSAITIINEVGSEQSLQFQQLYATEYLLGWFQPGQRIHIRHGLYRFKEGKMSTRKGNVIWLEDVLSEAEERALELVTRSGSFAAEKHQMTEEEKHEVAQAVGIGALKWNDLKRSSQQDIVFDWDDILSMQGNSGPYLQYTYARTASLLKNKPGDFEYASYNKSMQLYANEEKSLLRKLSHFEEVIAQSASQYSPHILCTYLFELAQLFNLFYQKLPILKAEQETRDFRLFLAGATGHVLKRGLGLLGIQTPEKM